MRLARAAALAALLAVPLLAGCAARTPQPTVITFWQPFEVATYDSLVARFERENPGVRVEVRAMSGPAMRDSIEAALASGAVPDLAVLDTTLVPSLLARGVLSDWSAGVADLRDSLTGWEACSVGDALYGMPWLLDARALWYDRGALARARLDAGTAFASWPEFVQAAAKLAATGTPVGLANDDPLGVPAACLFALGGVVAPGESDSLVVDSDAARLALSQLARLRAVARVAPRDTLAAAFAHGRLGVFAGRAGEFSAADRLASVPFPAPEAARSACAGVVRVLVLASFTRTAHKEAALRFARHLATPARAGEVAAALGEWTPSASRSGAFARQARAGWVPPAATHGPERARELAGLFGAIVFERALPDTALPGAQARLDRLREERP